MNKYKFLAAVVATALMSAAGVASAQVAVNGGGASLPADLYKGSGDSILPANFNYAVTGSGTGKSTFLGSGTFAGQTTVAHFIGSDSVLSGGPNLVPTAGSERAIYDANYNTPGLATYYGPLLQFPSVATSVTIPFNKAGAALNISDADLCRIFAGAVSDWSQVSGSGRSGELKIVYRDESSGTSELLTRFLTTVCPLQPGLDLSGTALKNGAFSVQSTFKNLFTGNAAPTARFVPAAATGGTALYNTVFSTEGYVGYVGPDVIPSLDDATRIAQLRGYSPNEVNVSATLGSIAPPSTPEELANPSRWAPVFTNPTTGYPIAGYTNFVIGQCYKNAAVATQIRLFLNRHYGTAGATDQAVRDHGFIPLTAAWKTAVREQIATVTAPNGLQNASVCGSGATLIGRP